jgi:hypothetical protein
LAGKDASAKGVRFGAVQANMLLTMHLSITETINYSELRGAIKCLASAHARRAGRLYAQVVGCDGRILDVLEVA